MKKLLILFFIALFCMVLSAGYNFDGRVIFSKHGVTKDSLYYLIAEKAGGVFDTIAEFDTCGTITWYYTFAGAGAPDSFYVKCTNTCFSGWVLCDDTIYVDTSGTGGGVDSFYIACADSCVFGWVFSGDTIWIDTTGVCGAPCVCDTLTIEGASDTLDIYFSNDTIFFDSKVGSAYLDLSEMIVLFGAGTMNLDDIQPATNDSSSSQIGTNTNPYGRGDFVDMKGIGYVNFQSADSLTIPLWNNCPVNAPIGAIGLDTAGTDTMWLKTEDGWGVISFGIP